MSMHPDAVAALIASILVEDDLARACARNNVDVEVTRAMIIDARRDQVLVLAREYYKVNPCDYDNGAEKRAARNATNNLAKLDRRNLR